MADKKKYYITTPIYYVNDKPHVGHFYCTVMADVSARFHRMLGEDVLFVTGTDENSQKILPVAEKEGIPLKDYVDRMAARWQDTWKKLGLTFDKFIRTTSNDHRLTVEKLFNRSLAKGDIYKKKYSGLYCVGCEKFLKESDLVDGVCIYHKTKPQVVEEENYFFKLSAYEKPLLDLLESGTFALPEFRCNEMIQFVKGGLEDVSISRDSLKWGIPLPTDQKHVFYVWYDALINYLTAVEYYKDSSGVMDQFWPHAVHLVGKDIFRFHAVMWPAMLLSAGLNPPKKVFGHGFFTVNGEKISKSLGNAIDPLTLSEKYGTDSVRFYILFDIPFGKDSDFSIPRLESQYNSFLANSYGNTVNRILNMIQRYTGSKVLPFKGKTRFMELRGVVEKITADALALFDTFKYDEFLKRVFDVIGICNKLIDDNKPWEMAKKKETEALEDLLYSLYEAIRIMTVLLHPVMPVKTVEVLSQMGIEMNFNKIDFTNAIQFGSSGEGVEIGKIGPIFPKIESQGDIMSDIKEINAPVPDSSVAGLTSPGSGTAPVVASVSAGVPNVAGINLITIDDFKKVELVVGQIKVADRIENADKLLKLTIDIGEEERTICAGIAMYYKPEELVGKKIVIVKNLEPRKLRGVMSQGMLLAAKDGETLSVLTLDRDVKPGSSVS